MKQRSSWKCSRSLRNYNKLRLVLHLTMIIFAYLKPKALFLRGYRFYQSSTEMVCDQTSKVLWEIWLPIVGNVRGSCKKFCHWVRITSVLRFIKHIFITNLQNISPLLKHIFVTFLPSREKQKIVFFWYLLETLINSAAKITSRRILISRKHFLKPWK